MKTTKAELRFLDYWKEQRQGSKFTYYLMYGIGYGMVITFFIFFGVMISGGISLIPIEADNGKVAFIGGLGLGLGAMVSILVRYVSEKKYRRLVKQLSDDLKAKAESDVLNQA